MGNRFPTWHVSIRCNRTSVGRGLVVAKPSGLAVDTEMPVDFAQRHAVLVLLLIVAHSLTDADSHQWKVTNLLQDLGVGGFIPQSEEVVVVEPKDDVEDDIPF